MRGVPTVGATVVTLGTKEANNQVSISKTTHMTHVCDTSHRMCHTHMSHVCDASHVCDTSHHMCHTHVSHAKCHMQHK